MCVPLNVYVLYMQPVSEASMYVDFGEICRHTHTPTAPKIRARHQYRLQRLGRRARKGKVFSTAKTNTLVALQRHVEMRVACLLIPSMYQHRRKLHALPLCAGNIETKTWQQLTADPCLCSALYDGGGSVWFPDRSSSDGSWRRLAIVTSVAP